MQRKCAPAKKQRRTEEHAKEHHPTVEPWTPGPEVAGKRGERGRKTTLTRSPGSPALADQGDSLARTVWTGCQADIAVWQLDRKRPPTIGTNNRCIGESGRKPVGLGVVHTRHQSKIRAG